MPKPRIHDDGATVELDLHGASIDEAIGLVQRTASLARQRGRSTLRVIHGSSTSECTFKNRTIKHAVQDVLDAGMEGVASHHEMEDWTLLNLGHSAQSDPSPITLLDLR